MGTAVNLYGPLPDNAGGYPVLTDFREWLGFEAAWHKGDIVGMVRVYRQLPPNVETAVKLAAEFYGGASLPYKHSNNRQSTALKTVDFLFDSQVIYAAFMAQYGIDLSAVQLHWYKFCALFYGLTGQIINDICGYRAAEPEKIKDKTRRAEVRRLKRIYAVPDDRTAHQRDQDNAQSLAALF